MPTGEFVFGHLNLPYAGFIWKAAGVGASGWLAGLAENT